MLPLFFADALVERARFTFEIDVSIIDARGQQIIFQ